jgi:hypothetical protein
MGKTVMTSLLGSERGVSLIETAVATSLVTVMMAGLLAAASAATKITENEGHLAARTAEYAQDKMEQLLALTWGDSTTDTTVFPSANNGGTGLAVGGSVNVAAPAIGYVDYLDNSGNLLLLVNGAAPPGWFYKRVWQISTPSANLKQLTVTTTVFSSVAGAMMPSATIAALKSNTF